MTMLACAGKTPNFCILSIYKTIINYLHKHNSTNKKYLQNIKKLHSSKI